MSGEFFLSPYDIIPFTGFRTPCDPYAPPASARLFEDERETYLSLMHWFESEKFRGITERYRRYLLMVPDPALVQMEASGFSSTHRRADWDSVRARVVLCGLFFLFQSNPDLFLAFRQAAAIRSDDELVSKALASLKAAFTDGQAAKRIHAMVAGPGDYTAPIDVHHRLDGVFEKARPFSVLVTGETGVGHAAEAWALRHYIPVEYVPIADEDTSITAYCHRVLPLATHIILMTRPEVVANELRVMRAIATELNIPTKLLSLAAPMEAAQ